MQKPLSGPRSALEAAADAWRQRAHGRQPVAVELRGSELLLKLPPTCGSGILAVQLSPTEARSLANQLEATLMRFETFQR